MLVLSPLVTCKTNIDFNTGCQMTQLRDVWKKNKYGYFQCRKKGLLTKQDLVKWLKFAKKCKQIPENIWAEGVSFYFDGTGWVHKTNLVQTARTRWTKM